jgi:hypothetical protein
MQKAVSAGEAQSTFLDWLTLYEEEMVNARTEEEIAQHAPDTDVRINAICQLMHPKFDNYHRST